MPEERIQPITFPIPAMPNRTPSPDSVPSRFEVAIIGAGFSGSMLAVHLAAAEDPPRVALIERTRSFGPGLAYGAAAKEHLLNVPAGKMSAFPDKPSDFLNWAREHSDEENITPGTFLPRVVYGRYLGDLLANSARRTPELELIDAEAVDVEPLAEGGVRIHFADGGTLEADNVILAWGNLPPTTPPGVCPKAVGDERFIHNPWSAEAREALAQPGDVLIIGSGLTCLDLLATAKKMGRTGPIHVLSRHGLFPQAHSAATPRRPFLDAAQLPNNMRRLFRQVRAEIALVESKGGDWRAVVDSLRPFIQDIWIGLPDGERRRFLRHVRTLWETLRHRAAQQMRAVKDEFESCGQLQRHKGRLERVNQAADAVEVIYRPRGKSESTSIRVQTVINATGPEVNPSRAQSPLLKNLLARRMAKPDRLGLGIEITPDFTDGADPLHTVGSLRKGTLWESTAVPELRGQAAELAKHLLASREAAAAGPAGHIWIFEI